MQRDDDDVEGCEAIVGEVEPAVGKDIDLGSGQHGKPFERFRKLANVLGMRQRPGLVQAVGHGQRLRVIGNRDELEAPGLCGGGHGLEPLAAVGLGGMHVQIAPEIGRFNQPGQRIGLGRFNLAPVLAQLRRDEGHAERV